MTIRRATILLIALIWVTSCGTPQEREAWILEKAEMVQTIERLQAEQQRAEGVIRDFLIPTIKVVYNSKIGCTVVEFETTADQKNVRFVNKTDSDATFTFPNAIFDVSVLTVAANTTETLTLAAGASAFAETDYAVESTCYKEPLPGPFILIP